MSVLAGRRIELWAESQQGAATVDSVLGAVLQELARAGAHVRARVLEQELVDPDELLHDPPDVVLLKSATTLATAVAVAGEKHGLRCVNAAAATLRARDKPTAVARLARAGVPVPETVLGDGEDGGRLLQAQVGDASDEIGVYAAGDVVFAGRKRFADGGSVSERIEPLDVSSGLVELVSAVRDALGLRVVRVDVRFEGSQPIVVDARAFPGFGAFPAAVAPLVTEVARSL